MTLFELSVEEDLNKKQREQVLADLEEVLGKHSLSLNDATVEII